MTLIPVNLATEDELSEITLFRILVVIGRYAVGTTYRRGGFGYLRRTIHGWNRAATGKPFIVLTDLDTCECPAELINDWLPVAKHPNLLFRIAVREVESWLLADPANLSEFFSIRKELIPTDTDALRDPKAVVVNLARKSRSKVIRDRPLGGAVRQSKDPTTTAASDHLFGSVGTWMLQPELCTTPDAVLAG